jgi:periplasmic protein TonB
MSDLTLSALTIDRKPSRALWVCAAVGALVLHLACAALVLERMKVDGGDDALGANAIEVGVEWTSPHTDDTDLPPGPDADEQAASPPMPDQKAETKPTDLPQDKPTETEDPDRVVTETKSEKPTEDDPKVQTQQSVASPESAAQVATAQQRLENAQEGATTAAPNIGLGKDKERLTADWGRKVSAYFELHKRFPVVEKSKTAKVKISLVLNRLGHVLSVAVAESSGDPLYDEAALAMVRRSDPVPPPPAKLTDDQFPFSLEVHFKNGK